LSIVLRPLGRLKRRIAPIEAENFDGYRTFGMHLHDKSRRPTCSDEERGRYLEVLRLEAPMSEEKPDDDPRERTDWDNTKQTDEPWKGPTEKDQRPGGPPPDLEKWHETNTH
jgi:hypothetical protein